MKQKAVHEATEITFVFLYLAIFFCTLATYSMLLLEKFEIWYFTYGPALLNALFITKIILIGEAVHFGKKHEAKPLIYSSIYKAFVYGLLVFGFHMVEEAVKRLIHGKDIAGRSATYASTTCWAAVLSFSWRSFLSLHSGSWSALSVRRNFGAFFSEPEHSRAITLRLTNQESEGQRRNLKRADPAFANRQRGGHPTNLGTFHFSLLTGFRLTIPPGGLNLEVRGDPMAVWKHTW